MATQLLSVASGALASGVLVNNTGEQKFVFLKDADGGIPPLTSCVHVEVQDDALAWNVQATLDFNNRGFIIYPKGTWRVRRTAESAAVGVSYE